MAGGFVYHGVHFFLSIGPILHQGLGFILGVVAQAGHLHVGSLIQREAAIAAPVGDGKADEVPHTPQHGFLEVGVGGGGGAVDLVIRRHDAQQTAVGHGRLEAGQMQLVHGLLGDLNVGAGAGGGVLREHGKVLAHGDNALVLHAFGLRCGDVREQIGVLAELVLGTAELRHAGDVELSTQLDVAADGLVFRAVDHAVLIGHIRVPGGGDHLLLGRVGGVLQIIYAGGAVVHPGAGHAQTGHADQGAGLAVGAGAAAAQQGEFLCCGHGLQQSFDLGVDLLIALLQTVLDVLPGVQLAKVGRSVGGQRSGYCHGCGHGCGYQSGQQPSFPVLFHCNSSLLIHWIYKGKRVLSLLVVYILHSKSQKGQC